MPVRVCGKPGEVRAPLVVSRLLSLLPRGLRARLTPHRRKTMVVLKNGKKGSAVKRWQLFLIGQGFDPGKVDGVFGPGTEKATIEFQRKHRLDPDGVVGNQTYGQAMLLGFELVSDSADDAKTGPNWPPKPGFPPLLSNSARQEVFGKYSYQHDPSPDNPDRITILDNWERENIVTVETPQLAGVKGAPRTGKVRFHRLASDQFRTLWKEWEDAGLLDRVLTWEGSFTPRFIRGSRTTLSNHAFGSAFDINYEWNRLGTQPALVGSRGCVRELVQIANEHGFYWGGHFSRMDGMHFEVARIIQV